MTSLWILVSAALCATVVYGSEPINLGAIASNGKYGILSNKREKLTDRDQTTSANARFRLEKLRPFFTFGFGGIPKLEPYKVAKPVHSVLIDHEIGAVIEYENLTLRGLQSFITATLEIRLKARRLDFKFYFPKLSGDVLYKTDLQVDASHNPLSGKVNVTLLAVTVEGAYQFELVADGYLKIVGLGYHILARDVQYNLQDQPQVRAKRSVPASELSKAIARVIAQVTANSVAETTVKELNTHLLPHYTEAQILRLIIPDEE